MQTKKWWIGLVAAGFLCSCALQEDVYTLDHRVAALERHSLELENRNRALQKQAEALLAAKAETSSLDQNQADDAMALRSQYAELAAQLQAYQDQRQLLSGRLDEMEYLLKQKLQGVESHQSSGQSRLDRMATDLAAMQKRLTILEQSSKKKAGQTPAPAPAATPVNKPVEPAAGGESQTDTALYATAKKAFDEGNMDAARSGFEKLIADFPNSTNADNAQFWIAESYYHEKWYEKAILEYQKVIENYPSGNKLPAALLKQALAFANIGETNNARLILKELIAKHPGTSEAAAAKQKLESM
ncbi:tol-pal system protein YbgF [Desulfosarcina ovata]|uniref:Tol-pal system protein YbgF n=1 Tax=Desulfosarcina ovata subsp. ovata TaxID=2752305 RepID=A0A5K8A8U3_9BACT|nr:tol-pal system protein YbgF [Desulfosarcina ovata]BBO88889.1 tol-pal system protein YbgF [Desulfosarcina ovata subsp. ovata]